MSRIFDLRWRDPDLKPLPVTEEVVRTNTRRRVGGESYAGSQAHHIE
jgi:hypothetical protein